MREEVLRNRTGELVLREEKRFDGSEFVELWNGAGEGVVDEAEGTKAANLGDCVDVDCSGET